MTVRRILTSALAALLLAIGAAYVLLPVVTVEIPKSHIDGAIETNLPHELDRGLVTVTVSGATVDPQADGRLRVNAEFTASGLTLEGVGRAAINSRLRYDGGKVYLSDLSTEDIDFQLSDNSSETISDIRSTISGILGRETEEAEAEGDAGRLQRLTGASDYIDTQLADDVLATVDGFLKTFPIYDLSRAEGYLSYATLALQDIGVAEGRVLVTVSLRTLLAVLGGAVGAVILLLFVVPRLLWRQS